MIEPATPKGEQTRTAIIEAAFEAFTTNGYHGTSMRRIAAGAGIAVGGIYNHFGSKEEIFTAVVRTYHPITHALPALLDSSGQTTEELLNDAAERFIAEFTQRSELLNLLFIELVELEGRHLPELVTTFLPKLQEFAAGVQASDERLRNVAPLTFVRTFFGMIFAYIFTERLLGDTQASRLDTTTPEDFVDIYLHGLLKPSTASEE